MVSVLLTLDVMEPREEGHSHSRLAWRKYVSEDYADCEMSPDILQIFSVIITVTS